MGNKKIDIEFMRKAIQSASIGIEDGQTPFGACIVKGDKVIVCAHNEVWKNKDITAHAEIVAIRQACEKLKTIDLSGCIMYSTCEPCPMCFTACHWARISEIVFGAYIKDAKRYGFNELLVSSESLKRYGKSKVLIKGGILRQDCLKLFDEWIIKNKSVAY